jgi:acyl-coenzyme A thioesterase PaaI-like protein
LKLEPSKVRLSGDPINVAEHDGMNTILRAFCLRKVTLQELRLIVLSTKEQGSDEPVFVAKVMIDRANAGRAGLFDAPNRGGLNAIAVKTRQGAQQDVSLEGCTTPRMTTLKNRLSGQRNSMARSFNRLACNFAASVAQRFECRIQFFNRTLFRFITKRSLLMSPVLSMFNTVGAEQVSKMICQMAPYFSTIDPTLVDLRPGRAEANVPFRKEITNHLGTVHAIALCNAAELVGGTMTDASIPQGARWIPKGMTVEYLAKAKTDLKAIADGSAIDWTSAGDKVVPIEILDTEGKKVFTARITMNVKLAP